jgi:hypothetical protein
VPRLDHPFPSWSFIWVKESIVFAARVMEQSFTWMNGWFDLSQGREAPAREASGPSRGSPRCRGYRGGAVAVRGGRVAGGYGYRGAYRAGAYRGYRAGAYPGYRYGVGAAAAATTPTATGFARTGTIRTERRDGVGL